MAFNLQKLMLNSTDFSDGPKVWIYTTEDDAIATINTSGYFNDASDRLSVYDMIRIKDSANVVAEAYVASNASGVVDITDGVVATATDTD